ncbi:lipopolysaccharide biosynthesis protein [Prevotella sp.]|uniref:lipopolysaccharide biosynthesis protein n=1 Tax=Prevotella sp. TaxID=59823 RepID=UPI00307A4511
MASLKSLAKDTAIYGLSSIVGRFLNYLLVPLYTAKLSAASGGYGVITNVYAYTALLMVILTYGMETTFFRFANKENENPQKVYTTTLISVGFTSLLFVILVLLFINPISAFMGYQDHKSYIWVMAITVAIDAFQCIPFAYLRYKKRPIKFAALKMLNIFMAIALNLVFFLILPNIYDSNEGTGFIAQIYNPTLGAGYAFYINLFCSAVLTFFFWKELFCQRYSFDKDLLKRMFSYSWPILVLGIAGILNQTADKILFPKIYTGPDAHTQLGIYGAASKIAMIMAMITQAFRYAYEPFVFGKSKDKDNRDTYAKAMKYFIIFTLLAFLVVVGYMDVLRHIIGRDYWDGVMVVPIVLAAAILLGVYFLLCWWWSLIDKTIWGAYFSGIGCIVLIAVNVIFVPKYGYMACAWAGFAGYGTAMVISYFVGQKKYPINYPMKEILVYVLITVVLYFCMTAANKNLSLPLALVVNTLLGILFIAYIIKKDFPLSSLPVIGKRFRK